MVSQNSLGSRKYGVAVVKIPGYTQGHRQNPGISGVCSRYILRDGPAGSPVPRACRQLQHFKPPKSYGRGENAGRAGQDLGIVKHLVEYLCASPEISKQKLSFIFVLLCFYLSTSTNYVIVFFPAGLPY